MKYSTLLLSAIAATGVSADKVVLPKLRGVAQEVCYFNNVTVILYITNWDKY